MEQIGSVFWYNAHADVAGIFSGPVQKIEYGAILARRFTMRTIRVLEKTGKDGTLLLRIPLGQPEAEFEVVVVVQPTESAAATRPEERGWPPEYFDLAGSITDETFVRQPQGELPKAIDFE
jgi:hypothetical protein